MSKPDRSSSLNYLLWLCAIVGFVSLLLFCLITHPRFRGARYAAPTLQCKNNLKRIGQALRAYHDEHGLFPPQATRDQSGKPLLSWRVLILPYLGQAQLYNQFDLSKAWDNARNIPLRNKMPKVFYCPRDGISDSKTNYICVTGDGTLFPPDYQVGLKDVTDDHATTIMVLETTQGRITWTEPNDLSLSAISDLQTLLNPNGDDAVRFALTVKGYVYLVFDRVDQQVWKSALTISGNETILPTDL